MFQFNFFSDVSNVITVRESLKKQGYYLHQDAYDLEFCKQTIQFMDNYRPENSSNSPKHEINYGSSELRIWDAHKQDNLLNQFCQECDFSMSSIIKKRTEASTLLAIKNEALISQDEILKKDRWHIDSFFKQLKIFLFLTDTHEQSGPFEFIPFTNSKAFKLTALCKGKYLRPRDLLSDKRTYQKISDVWVENLQKKGFNPKPIICKAGTLLIVDTSLIHRARPCITGSRYALTAYYR